jgi:hypothetical protein
MQQCIQDDLLFRYLIWLDMHAMRYDEWSFNAHLRQADFSNLLQGYPG